MARVRRYVPTNGVAQGSAAADHAARTARVCHISIAVAAQHQRGHLMCRLADGSAAKVSCLGGEDRREEGFMHFALSYAKARRDLNKNEQVLDHIDECNQLAPSLAEESRR